MYQNNHSPYIPLISPVPDEVPRPLWSVMIPTYNCAEYLRETLAGILAQDPGPNVMQIMVIDDYSTKDNPEAVVEEIGKGRVEFYQQLQNVGVTRNFQTCLEYSRGYLVHQLHGDDIVLDGFYQQMEQVFERCPEVGAAFCRTIFMNEKGHWQWISGLERDETGILPEEWLKKIAGICCITTPSMVVRREVYEKLGGFDHRLRTTEDWEMWVRIAANYPIAHEVKPLAVYRVSSNSNMNSNLTNGRHAEQMYNAISIFETYLGDRIPDSIYKNAKQSSAFMALHAAEFCMKDDKFFEAITHIKTALQYRFSFRVIRSAGRIFIVYITLFLLKSAFSEKKEN